LSVGITLATDIDERKRAEDKLEKAFEEIKTPQRPPSMTRNVVLREQIDQVFMFEEIVGSLARLENCPFQAS